MCLNSMPIFIQCLSTHWNDLNIEQKIALWQITHRYIYILLKQHSRAIHSCWKQTPKSSLKCWTTAKKCTQSILRVWITRGAFEKFSLCSGPKKKRERLLCILTKCHFNTCLDAIVYTPNIHFLSHHCDVARSSCILFTHLFNFCLH